MHITLAQAQSIMGSRIFAEKLPPAVSYKFAKLGKLLVGEMQTMEEERKKLLVSMGAILPAGAEKLPPNAPPVEYQFPKGNKAEFQAAFKELTESTVDIGCHWPMEVPNIELSPLELMALDPLFDVPEEPATPEQTPEARPPKPLRKK